MANKVVTSSDSDALTATAQVNASVKSHKLQISNLAATQVNAGSASPADAKSVIGEGFNVFKLTTGSSSKNISVNISSTDTNKSAFTKLAAAINKSDVGVKASVTTDSANKTSLTLESTKTGTKNAFSLSDLQGNAVSATSIGTVKSKAQNAVYTLDNKQYTSASNTVNLDNGKVQATLKKAGSEQISMNVVPDTSTKSLPDYYTYLNNMLSKGNYNAGTKSGSFLDMFL